MSIDRGVIRTWIWTMENLVQDWIESADSTLFKSSFSLHCSMREYNLVSCNLLSGEQLIHLASGCLIFKFLTYVMQSGDASFCTSSDSPNSCPCSRFENWIYFFFFKACELVSQS